MRELPQLQPFLLSQWGTLEVQLHLGGKKAPMIRPPTGFIANSGINSKSSGLSKTTSGLDTFIAGSVSSDRCFWGAAHFILKSNVFLSVLLPPTWVPLSFLCPGTRTFRGDERCGQQRLKQRKVDVSPHSRTFHWTAESTSFHHFSPFYLQLDHESPKVKLSRKQKHCSQVSGKACFQWTFVALTR